MSYGQITDRKSCSPLWNGLIRRKGSAVGLGGNYPRRPEQTSSLNISFYWISQSQSSLLNRPLRDDSERM